MILSSCPGKWEDKIGSCLEKFSLQLQLSFLLTTFVLGMFANHILINGACLLHWNLTSTSTWPINTVKKFYILRIGKLPWHKLVLEIILKICITIHTPYYNKPQKTFTLTVPSAAVTARWTGDRPTFHPASWRLSLKAWGTIHE